MRFSRRISALGCLALLSLGIATPRPSSADGSNVVTIYSAQKTQVDAQLYQLFTEKTGIKVTVVQSKPAELLQRIKLEGDNSDADLFMTVDATDLWHAADENLLQPITAAEITAQVPAKMRDPENRWIAIASRARLIVYNKTKVKLSKLSTYEALAEPRWQSEILARSATTGDIQAFIAAMIDALGEERAEAWARGMAQNFGQRPQGSDVEQVRAILGNTGVIALCSSDKVARLFASKDPALQQQLSQIGVFYPNQADRGVHIDLAGAGLVAHAPHAANALKFLAFLVSADAQRLIADVNFEYPVRADVPANAVITSWGDFKADDPRVPALVHNNAGAILLLNRVGWQ